MNKEPQEKWWEEFEKLLSKWMYGKNITAQIEFFGFIRQNFVPKERVEEAIEKIKDWRQCNDCFDEEHCKGKVVKCECRCVANREERIKERHSEINQLLSDLRRELLGEEIKK